HVIWPVNTEYEIFTVNRKRHTQGAVFVLNHQTPLNLPTPPVRPVAEEARRQKALLDLDKHSWAWSMMIVPLMNVDLFELSNNHNWRTQFGFPQWTLENAPDWPEVERTDQGFTELGWTEFAMQTFYALQNCGFRMRVTGGTGSGVHPVPLGHGRVYVHVDGPFSYEKWIAGLDAGHSFVTTGPLMNLHFNDALPGSMWQRDAVENQVRIQGEIRAANPLKSIQVIANGQIVLEQQRPAARQEHGGYVWSIDESIILSGSSWVAVRCFEDLPNQKVSFAHTNPIYLDVAGMPLQPRKRDAEFFVQRMDEEIARNTGILSGEALAEYREARDIYNAILNQTQGLRP
ncbi:MAG: CehA/McbA family metallohydrolase, partial [Planctomycetaceae bacterium]|nr:CehA/McbA family metallohydrolase [Planctomycetaceae bacterium]